MPVEIKELVIKTSVENGMTNNRLESNSTLSEDLIEDIIAQCVDQVMEILQDQKQR